VKVPPTGPSGRAAAVISILGTYFAQRAAGDGLGPHTAAYRRRIQDHESQAFPHVPRALSMVLEGGAAGTRTQDRRIMSPARPQLASGYLTWADKGQRDHVKADLGTYLA
jgi:hypothetical protein